MRFLHKPARGTFLKLVHDQKIRLDSTAGPGETVDETQFNFNVSRVQYQ